MGVGAFVIGLSQISFFFSCYFVFETPFHLSPKTSSLSRSFKKRNQVSDDFILILLISYYTYQTLNVEITSYTCITKFEQTTAIDGM